MIILRSLLFIPAISEKMLDKMPLLNPDAFLLDLEDSVPNSKKEQARENICTKLKSINIPQKIFIRINDLESNFYIDDIKVTISEKINGYMIPKFENIEKVKEVIKLIEIEENKNGIGKGNIRIILMIENPAGILELNNLRQLGDYIERVLALTIGWEDFTRNITVFSDISEDLLDFVRFKILLYSKAYNFLAIDTIYKRFKDDPGLEKEVSKVVKMGFNGKLAIHPAQIDIINKGFLPSQEEIQKMNIILNNRERIEREGAININGVMYDPPHLKWALKTKEYIDNLNLKS